MELDKWVLLVTLLVCTTSFPFGCEGKADGPTQPLANAPIPTQPLADGPTQQMIDRICRQNEDYGFCNRAINQGLHTPSANLNQLVDLTIYLALKHATEVYIYIGNILRSADNPRERQGLQTCLDVYKTESGLFAEATLYFKKRLYQQMRDSILSGPKTLYRCSTNFGVPPIPENPLIEKNREMRIFITMAAIAGHLLGVMPKNVLILEESQ